MLHLLGKSEVPALALLPSSAAKVETYSFIFFS